MGEQMSGSEFKVSVILEQREDGGLRAYSEQVPGLILSSKNIQGLLDDVPAVLSACLSHTLGKQITVAPLFELKDILAGEVESKRERSAPGTKEFVAHIHQMIIKSLRRDQWERKLRSMGLERREDLGSLNTAEFWGDGTRYPISVPVDENGEVEFWAFQKICRLIDPNGIWSNWTGDDC